MSVWGELPAVRGGDPDADKYSSRPGGARCCGHVICGPNWQLTALFWVVLVGVTAFVGLEVALVSKGDQLEATSRATVSMHDETTKMKEDIGAALKKWRSNFPINQETVTTEQILDSIDKMHSTVAWIDQVRRGIAPETLHSVMSNADALIRNVTELVDIVGSVFAKSSAKTSRDASGFLQKGAELLGSISAAEFHDAFLTAHAAVQSVVRVSQNISNEKFSRVIDSAADILGAAESEHIVAVISDLTKGASEVLRRFTGGEGVRVSMPQAPVDKVTTPENPAAPKTQSITLEVREPVAIGKVSLPVDAKRPVRI